MPPKINPREIEFIAIRAQGPGGQNVNKVSSAVHLRFDINASSLPESAKQTLLALSDQRLTKDGCIVIKAQSARSRDQNRLEAIARLEEMVAEALHVDPVRRATKPSYGAKQRRLKGKAIRAQVKAGRGKAFE
ncbi:alternative ribosome rescue aminoacyl-tRNA hydrolase ArfB [Derxia lacustris]|uniref:alternative ribosome rescue aminoacyl-tRNA hydrolase ArfB n=1 Tax=Derxia lacustris TaxID=764842 RepID=UPI000A173DF9|nr:alternative ribosome rescue aminoacyl-tRNA hydrolase ArfB [Derxia lacustris]